MGKSRSETKLLSKLNLSHQLIKATLVVSMTIRLVRLLGDRSFCGGFIRTISHVYKVGNNKLSPPVIGTNDLPVSGKSLSGTYDLPVCQVNHARVLTIYWCVGHYAARCPWYDSLCSSRFRPSCQGSSVVSRHPHTGLKKTESIGHFVHDRHRAQECGNVTM